MVHTMHTTQREPSQAGAPNRSEVLKLAASFGCDPRTAERILRHGPDVIRPRALKERARATLAGEPLVPPGFVRTDCAKHGVSILHAEGTVGECWHCWRDAQRAARAPITDQPPPPSRAA